MDQKKENGERWSGHRRRESQGRTEKGQKAENVEKMEHKREAKQNYGQAQETEGRQRRRREGNRKEQDEWERM